MELFRMALLTLSTPMVVGGCWFVVSRVAENIEHAQGPDRDNCMPPHPKGLIISGLYIALCMSSLWFALLLWQ